MRFLGRWLLRILVSFAAVTLVAFALDWTVYKLRGSPQSVVIVNRFLSVPLKGQRRNSTFWAQPTLPAWLLCSLTAANRLAGICNCIRTSGTMRDRRHTDCGRNRFNPRKSRGKHWVVIGVTINANELRLRSLDVSSELDVQSHAEREWQLQFAVPRLLHDDRAICGDGTGVGAARSKSLLPREGAG